ncbi:MAG TPA: septum site-determining protein Ssd [Pseudonocardiaceae bacterium]|jgi:secretion/DNA translocation related CpaE-like protein|nr:septum site-determining protein Ssd [Pseudonocardiaceae bacterium]
MNTDRPLALLDHEPLLDALLQLAAVAGSELERAADVTAARRGWAEAPLVLLDESAAQACAEAGLPRRTGVVVLCSGDPPEALWQKAFAVGADRVLTLPAEEPWLISALADATDHPAPTAGRVLAVLGGRGGAGASVFAVALAMTALRRGGGALLVDCDPLGGGIDLLLGAEAEVGLRWPDLRIRGGRVPVSALRSALPGRSARGSRLAVISCDREGPGPEPDALAAVVDAGRRAGDTVICDLPRDLSDAARAALDRAALVALLVPAEVRAVAAARRLAGQLSDRGARVAALVRGPAPGGLRAEEIADAVGLPLLAAMRPEPNLAATLDRGGFRLRPRGPLGTAAKAVLDAAPVSAALSVPIPGRPVAEVPR